METQLIEGYKQKLPISFYWKAHTVSLIGRRILIIDILFVPLSKLGFSINNQLQIKSIADNGLN